MSAIRALLPSRRRDVLGARAAYVPAVAMVVLQLVLFPIALLVELIVEVLAVVALVLAIVQLAQGRMPVSRGVALVVGALALIGLGPILLWFGNVANPGIGVAG